MYCQGMSEYLIDENKNLVPYSVPTVSLNWNVRRDLKYDLGDSGNINIDIELGDVCFITNYGYVTDYPMLQFANAGYYWVDAAYRPNRISVNTDADFSNLGIENSLYPFCDYYGTNGQITPRAPVAHYSYSSANKNVVVFGTITLMTIARVRDR